MRARRRLQLAALSLGLLWAGAFIVAPSPAQSIDRTQNPNIANAGIAKSLAQEIGAGRGDVMMPDSSAFIISRDPFRAIRRGRQVFQRKFLRRQGVGPLSGDGVGDINSTLALGAGLSDSCASCHARPKGAAGFGGDVVTRPDSRDVPHLFGLGIKEMLADEITADLRALRSQTVAQARAAGADVTSTLTSKGISYGSITAHADGSVETSQVRGVDADLRVRPFFAHGGTISIREFLVGAFNAEMGLQGVDPELMAAHDGGRFVTPSGMLLDGSQDQIEAPATDDPDSDPDGDGVVNELPTSIIDYEEFYLLNYFKPATYEQTDITRHGLKEFNRIGCAQCHIPNLPINRDRRVADVETVYEPTNGIFNNLFATAAPLFQETDDHNGYPTWKTARLAPFLVRSIFADFKRHDLGPAFYERNYDGTMRKEFMTATLWGVGTTGPYGHDGRSINLREAILRHGGEAQGSRDAFARLSPDNQADVLAFLNSLVLFPPDDTASNFDPGNRNAANFPQSGHGSIRLTSLFNNPNDPE